MLAKNKMYLLTYNIQVNPSEVWLRDLYDDTLHFPEDGLFTFSGDVASYATMVVEGPPATPPSLGQRPSTSRAATVSSTPQHNHLPPPTFRSVTSQKRLPSFSLKITKAMMQRQVRGKPHFNPQSQMFVDINENTATLDYILASVRKQWGSEYTIVTNDGLEIDSSSTQGNNDG